MLFLKKSLLLFLLLCVQGFFPIFGQDFSEVNYYREATLANSTCLKSFDVNMNFSMFTSKAEGGGLSAVEYTARLAVDLDQQSLFGVTTCKLEREAGPKEDGEASQPANKDSSLLESEKDEKQNTITIMSSLLIHEGKGYDHRLPGVSRFRGQKVEFDTGYKLLMIPEVRGVGLVDFPEGCNSLRYAEISKQRAQLIIPQGYETQTDLRDSTIAFRARDGDRRLNYSYNTISLQPEKILYELQVDGQWIPEIEEIYSWKEIDGLYVPEQILRSESSIVNSKLTVETYHSLTISWQSVNQGIDKGLLDPKKVSDLEFLRKLVAEAEAAR
jgi:hypothetical protein